MKYSLIFIFSVLLFSGNCQKIILKNNLKRSVIKPGEYIGITLKGEKNHFSEWKSLCRECKDTTVMDYIWKVDSIGKNNITISQLYKEDSCFKFDTVNYMTFQRKEKQYADWIVHEYFDSPDGDYLKSKYILKFPVYQNIKTIPLDSIESFTFPKNYYCRTGTITTPLAALVFIIAAPFVAQGEDKFHWEMFVFAEAAGIYQGLGFYKAMDKNKVKTYSVDHWHLKIK